jgi:hypothetical protein
MPQRTGPSKYAPLTRYLAALRADAVTLTLDEVEPILGAPLPVSARHPTFWANSRLGLFRVRPWLEAGWWMARTDLRSARPAVTFARVVPRVAD